jgi:hypothetical protein
VHTVPIGEEEVAYAELMMGEEAPSSKTTAEKLYANNAYNNEPSSTVA